MPSGSHGGSPGSHSSGGSHSSSHRSSSSSHSSSSSRYSSRRTCPIRYSFYGHSYYIPLGSRIYSLFAMLMPFIVFCVIMFITMIVMSVSQNNFINKMEDDQKYYFAMIDLAEKDSSYQRTGVITDYAQSDNCDKYYFTYSFAADDGFIVDGYTFSIYTLDQVSGRIGDYIQLAVNGKYTTFESDSIPMDYKNFTLENDGEYVKAKNEKRVYIPISVILGIAIVGMLTALVVTFIKNSRKKEEEEKLATANNANAQVPKIRRCKYCGSALPDGETHCKHCGANN